MRCSSSPAVHPSFDVSGSPVVAPRWLWRSLSVPSREASGFEVFLQAARANQRRIGSPSIHGLGPCFRVSPHVAAQNHSTVIERCSRERPARALLRLAFAPLQRLYNIAEPRALRLRRSPEGSRPSSSRQPASSHPLGGQLADSPELASLGLRCVHRFSQPLDALLPAVPPRPCLMPVSLLGFAVLQRVSLQRRRRGRTLRCVFSSRSRLPLLALAVPFACDCDKRYRRRAPAAFRGVSVRGVRSAPRRGLGAWLGRSSLGLSGVVLISVLKELRVSDGATRLPPCHLLCTVGQTAGSVNPWRVDEVKSYLDSTS